MKKLLSTLLAVLMTVSIFAALPAMAAATTGDNLVTNGNFEAVTGDFATGWAVEVRDYNGLAAQAAVSAMKEKGSLKLVTKGDGDAVTPIEGDNCVKIYQEEGVTSNQYIHFSPVALEGNKNYIFTGWINAQSAMVDMGINYAGPTGNNGSMIIATEPITTDGWKKFTLIFTASAYRIDTQKYIPYFVLRMANSGTVYFDDIQLYAVDTESKDMTYAKQTMDEYADIFTTKAKWGNAATSVKEEDGNYAIKVNNSAQLVTNLMSKNIAASNILRVKFRAKLVTDATEGTRNIGPMLGTGGYITSCMIPVADKGKWLEYDMIYSCTISGAFSQFTLANHTGLQAGEELYIDDLEVSSYMQEPKVSIGKVLYQDNRSYRGYGLLYDNNPLTYAAGNVNDLIRVDAKIPNDATGEVIVGIYENRNGIDVLKSVAKYACDKNSYTMVEGMGLPEGSNVASGSIPIFTNKLNDQLNTLSAGNYTIKAFLWNSMAGMQPIADLAEQVITIQ